MLRNTETDFPALLSVMSTAGHKIGPLYVVEIHLPKSKLKPQGLPQVLSLDSKHLKPSCQINFVLKNKTYLQEFHFVNMRFFYDSKGFLLL